MRWSLTHLQQDLHKDPPQKKRRLFAVPPPECVYQTESGATQLGIDPCLAWRMGQPHTLGLQTQNTTTGLGSPTLHEHCNMSLAVHNLNSLLNYLDLIF